MFGGRGLFGAILFLLLAPLSWATTTVTGSIKNLGTGAVTPGSLVRFWLRGCAGNQPRINGTAVIAPTQGGVFFFDLAADASGNISGTIYSTRDNAGTGNGDIECGGSKTAVWYGMQVFNAGKGGPETPVHAKSGATLDVTQVTPITTNPVIAAPTGDTTYLRLDAGNSPIIGNLTVNGTVNDAGGTHTGPETFTGGVFGLAFREQFFTSNGTFTIPAGITAVKVTVVGGGGGGGGANATLGGSGGGSAGFGIKWLSGLTPGNTLTVTVGPGGTGVSSANGNSGTASTVASGTQTISTITANGGGGGVGIGASGGAGGPAGAAGSGADLNGSGSGGQSITPAAAATAMAGAGAAGPFGGGAQSPGITGTGNAGFNWGSGGSGALGGASAGGGAGSPGIVIFEWIQ